MLARLPMGQLEKGWRVACSGVARTVSEPWLTPARRCAAQDPLPGAAVLPGPPLAQASAAELAQGLFRAVSLPPRV
eukprot:COSAG01_NODE_1825_length_9137_cov_246.763886_8_plen_76_part_00